MNDRIYATIGFSLGKIEAAHQQYRDSMKDYERAVAIGPGTRLPLEGLSSIQGTLGALALYRGNAGEASKLFEQSLTISSQLASAEPENTWYQYSMASCHHKLGMVETWTGHDEAAIERYERSLETLVHLADTEPENQRYAKEMCRLLENLGWSLFKSGSSESAAAVFRRALSLREEMNNGHGDDPGLLNGLAWSYLTIPFDSLRDTTRAEALSKAATEMEPSNPFFAATRGLALLRSERYVEAAIELEKSKAFLSEAGGFEHSLFLSIVYEQLDRSAEAKAALAAARVSPIT